MLEPRRLGLPGLGVADIIKAKCAAVAIEAMKKLDLVPAARRFDLVRIAMLLYCIKTGVLSNDLVESCDAAIAADELTRGRTVP